MSERYSAGVATAYGAALRGGYTGTYNDFCNDVAKLGNITEELGNISAEATTLEAGSSATASYNEGVFAFGIPRGNTGAQGERGETGAKGDKGDTGETGATGATGNGIASIAKTGTSGLVDTYTITFTDGTTTTFDVTNGAEAIDTTLSIAGRAADAKATGSLLIPTHNHVINYDYTVFASDYVEGKYYGTNGSIGTSASYNYYAKIPVVKGNTYHFVGGRGARYVVLYNNNMIVQTAEIVTAFTAQYDGELYVTEFSATPLKMYLYNDFYKITEWTNDNVNGYRYSTSADSHIHTASTAGDIMHLKLKSYDGSHFSSFLLYAVVNGVNTIVATLYSVPNEVVFIAPNASDYLWYINRSQSETANFEFELTNYTKKTIFNSLDKLEVSDRFKGNIYGKKIACLGDSFTYGVATYVAKMNSRYLSNAKNYGVASSRIVLDATSGGTTIQSFLNRYASMDDDADIITVFGGINDSYDIGAGVLDIGDINSALDTTTFYGGFKLLVTNLMRKYPDKQIIGIIPPDCQYGQYYIENLPAVQQAERDVYNMYGIPIIDIKKDCFKMSTLAEMVALYRGSSTDIHPSQAGQEALCDTISAGIRRIIP